MLQFEKQIKQKMLLDIETLQSSLQAKSQSVSNLRGALKKLRQSVSHNFQSIGGYHCNFVEEPPSLLICPICQLPMRDPHSVSCCNAIMCLSCIQGTCPPCPICQKTDSTSFFIISGSASSKEMKKHVSELQVYCDFKDNGCKWIGTLRQLNEHNKFCNYNYIQEDIEYSSQEQVDKLLHTIARMDEKEETLKDRIKFLEDTTAEMLTRHDELIFEKNRTIEKFADGLHSKDEEIQTLREQLEILSQGLPPVSFAPPPSPLPQILQTQSSPEKLSPPSSPLPKPRY